MGKAPSVSKVDEDEDILAVRALIAQTDTAKVEVRSELPERSDAHVRKRVRLPAIEAVSEPGPDPEPRQRTAHMKKQARIVLAVLWLRIKTYRPHRGSVLLTSLVLLLVIQLAFVLGWTFLGLVIVLGCYFVMGSEAFWRRVLVLFATWQRIQPSSARSLKVRAYVLSRKWDKIIAKLPERLARKAQLPDLRNLMAADERHHAALNERLGRLG